MCLLINSLRPYLSLIIFCNKGSFFSFSSLFSYYSLSSFCILLFQFYCLYFLYFSNLYFSVPFHVASTSACIPFYLLHPSLSIFISSSFIYISPFSIFLPSLFIYISSFFIYISPFSLFISTPLHIIHLHLYFPFFHLYSVLLHPPPFHSCFVYSLLYPITTSLTCCQYSMVLRSLCIEVQLASRMNWSTLGDFVLVFVRVLRKRGRRSK